MTTIKFVPEFDLNGDGKVSLDEMIKGAMWIAFWTIFAIIVVWMALMGIAYAVFGWENWDTALTITGVVLLLSLVAGVLGAAIIGIKRSLLPEWQQQQALQDVAMERKRREFELEQIMGITDRESGTRWDDGDQDRLARLFLSYSYDKGEFITRKEWTDRGLSEATWNRINDLLQKYSIRHGRSKELRHDSFAEAWGMWCDKVTKSRRWVRDGEDNFVKD